MKLTPIAALLGATLISLTVTGVAQAQPAPGQLEVVVWNIRRAAGHIRVQICTRSTFADAHQSCPYHGDAPAQVGTVTVMVPDVPPGNYAAEVYQDEDDRNVLRRGPLGVPMEGVGFSNDVPISLTPPKFNGAAFDFDPAAPVALHIKLRYFPNL